MFRTHTVRVSGRIVDASGRPTTGGSVLLIPSKRSPGGVVNVGVGARLLDDGRFEFANVAAGDYVIRVDRGRTQAWREGEFGVQPVVVGNADVTGLVVQTSAGSSIAGHFTFDVVDRTSLPPAASIELTPVPVDVDLAPAQPATADIRSDGTFDIGGIHGARRLQLTRVPPGWMLKEIRVAGMDVTDRAIAFDRLEQSVTDVEIVLTDRVTELRGTIADRNANPVADATVIVFPTDRGLWYPMSRFVRKGVSRTDGTFTIAALPVGVYNVVALGRSPLLDDNGWQDPALLESLMAHAAIAAITDGPGPSVNLRIVQP
jgi:hypothetical protein